MSRVARSARTASKQRTEFVTADKTIVTPESGETYFVSGASDVVLTLPKAEDGLYFRVIPMIGMQNFVAVTSSQSFIVGGILQVTGASSVSVVQSDQGYGVKLTPSVDAAKGFDYLDVRSIQISSTSNTYAYLVQGAVTGTAEITI